MKNRLDCAILEVMLVKCRAVSNMSAATCKVISSEMDIKVDTLYRRLAGLAGHGYVEKGILDRREHTYYVTAKGKQALKEAKDEK